MCLVINMRLNAFPSILKIAVLISGIIIDPIVPIDYGPYVFNSVMQGPFYADKPIDLNFTIVSDHYIEDVSIGIIGCDGNKEEWVNEDTYGVKSGIFDLDENIRKHVTLHLIGKCATAPYTHYKLALIDEDDGMPIFSIYFDMRIRQSDHQGETFNLLRYQNTTLSLTNNCFKITNNKVTYDNEWFEFENYYDYFLLDEYYRLSLEQFKCKHSITGIFEWKEAYMELINPQPCFQGLCDSNGVAKLDLNISADNSIMFSVEKKSPLYIDPKTKLMYSSPKPGYKQTNYFYLPINGQEEVEKQEFRISLIGVGFWKSNFIWNLHIDTSVNLIGDCQTSKYCLVGGSK